MPASLPAFFIFGLGSKEHLKITTFTKVFSNMFYRRHLFLLVLLFFLAYLPGFSQGKEDKTEKLAQIRQKFQAINSETNYKVVKVEDAELILGHATDGGASITGYYKDGTIQKIIEWVGLSNKVVQNEYYLDSSKLIFVYVTESQYAYNDSLQTLDYSKLVPLSNGRYYFVNSRLFDAVLSRKEREKSKKDDAKSFLQRTSAYKALLNKQKS